MSILSCLVISMVPVSCNHNEAKYESFHQHTSPEFGVDSHYYQIDDLCIVTVWRIPKGVQSVFSTPKDAPLDPLFCALIRVTLPSAKNKQWGAVSSHDDMTAKLIESANEKVWYQCKYTIDPNTGVTKADSIVIADRTYPFNKGRLFLVDARPGVASAIVQLEGLIPPAAVNVYVREKPASGNTIREFLRLTAANNDAVKKFVGEVK